MQLLNVIMQLITLETFSMLEGSWQMHHRAARLIIQHLEYLQFNRSDSGIGVKAHSIEQALRALPENSERRRTMLYGLTNFVWIDIVAIATFGEQYLPSIALDYVRLQSTRSIVIEETMGCDGRVIALVSQVSQLEGNVPGLCHRSDLYQSFQQEYDHFNRCLTAETRRLEIMQTPTNIDIDIKLVSIVWAHAARVFLATISLHRSDEPSQDQELIETCLRKLEALPSRLLMRAHWPYTIIGCVARHHSQHERLRELFNRTMQRGEAPGLTWKGLMVMEECWKQSASDINHPQHWRQAMQRLKARVLLV